MLQYELHEMMYNTEHNYYNNKKKLEICNNIAEAISEIEEGSTTNDIKNKVSGLRN